MLEEVINGPTITLLNTRREFSIRLLVMRLEFEVYAWRLNNTDRDHRVPIPPVTCVVLRSRS